MPALHLNGGNMAIFLIIIFVVAVIFLANRYYAGKEKRRREQLAQKAKCKQCGMVASIDQFNRKDGCPQCGSDNYTILNNREEDF